MISTPICDFVRDYAGQQNVRLHMPGHKGASRLGCEALDITEITGADDLFHANGIIAESEANASNLFGCPTFYSTEGSSLCIRAMLFLAAMGSMGERPLILAGRNAHKSLLNTAVLLDLDIQWLIPKTAASYHACCLTAEDVEAALNGVDRKPCAVYLTSPDYLGNMVDIQAIGEVAHRHGVLLLVDNAHGAYLKFLQPSRHPMDLGADLCCDSAHKTLPVLTGGAYLHISQEHPEMLSRAKDAMALFGSTSPSYLIMQSLDLANPYMESLTARLAEFLPQLAAIRRELEEWGYTFLGEEPMKLTLNAKAFGYTGEALADRLAEMGIVCEFSDPDYLVLMPTPENTPEELHRMELALKAILRKKAIVSHAFQISMTPARMTPRQACFSSWETLPVEECQGRILAAANVSCPPAIPIVMCGEEITEEAIALFHYYGIETCRVVKE